MTKAVGYIRVSTNKQAEAGISLGTQRKQIEEYCNDSKRKWKLVKVYRDVFSGAKADRPDYKLLMEAAKKKEFEHVVVADLTRFGRSAVELHKSVQLLQTYGIAFHSIKGNIDTSDTNPFKNLMFSILMAMAEFEREMIFVRTHENREAVWKEKRSFIGHLPYGYAWDDKAEKIIEVKKEADVYRRMLTLLR